MCVAIDGLIQKNESLPEKKVLSPRIELGLPESEPDVITNYTMRDLLVSAILSKYKVIRISEASGGHLCFDFS